MKQGMMIFIFLLGVVSGLADEKPEPKVCKDEGAMVSDYQKGLAEMVDTVRKESLEDFERAFHRRSALSKLNLAEGILDIAADCFDEAMKDPSTTNAQKEAYQAKRDNLGNLRNKLIQYRTTLKAKEEGKESKDLIETFALTE